MRKTKAAGFIILFIISFFLRVVIVPLSVPNAVVFDETHFGGFVSNYIKGEFFFDIHPPLSKILLFCAAKMASYDGNFNFSALNEPYFNETEKNIQNPNFYSKIRLLPAVLGSFISPFLYEALILKGSSFKNAFVCGIISTLDGLTITQCRLILTDGILYYFVSFAIMVTFYIEYRSKQNMLKKNIKNNENLISISLLILQGLISGCAFSSKFAAGGLLLFIGFSHAEIIYQRCFKKKSNKNENECLISEEKEENTTNPLLKFVFEISVVGIILISCVLFILFASFDYHFKLLPNHGPGDAYIGCFNKTEKCEFQQYSSVKKTIKMICLMLHYNKGINSYHPYSSRWYQWAFGVTEPLLAYSQSGRRNMLFYIFPTACIMSTLGFFYSIYSKKISLIIGYAFSLFPFALFKRATFIYHYEIPMMFGLISFFIMADKMPAEERNILHCFILAITLLLFILFFPQLYCVYSPFMEISVE